MPINLALDHVLLSKHVWVDVTKALIISFAMLSTASVVMIKENADALLSSDLPRLNSDYELRTIQQKVIQNVSPFTSTSPPADFAFFYSFGIIGETNNTIISEDNVHIKYHEGDRPTNTTFTLSEAQMQNIWNAITETGFFQIKNNFTENCDNSRNCLLVTPQHYSILKVTGNNSTHTVIAHEGYAFPHNVEYQKFKSLVDEIDSMIETVLHQNDNTTDNNNNDNDNTIPSNDREPDRGFI
jgi:hypothetical protein